MAACHTEQARAALKAFTAARHLRKKIDTALGSGGESNGLVRLELTKLECALLLAMIDDALK